MMNQLPRRVLLVEDSEPDQFIARHLVRRHWSGCELLIANNGQEALRVLDDCGDQLPDLILLDINMPRMNGHQFLAAWYEQHGLDIPVVVMLTSSDQEKDREQAARYDCVRDYLLKPISVETLARAAGVLPRSA